VWVGINFENFLGDVEMIYTYREMHSKVCSGTHLIFLYQPWYEGARFKSPYEVDLPPYYQLPLLI